MRDYLLTEIGMETSNKTYYVSAIILEFSRKLSVLSAYEASAKKEEKKQRL